MKDGLFVRITPQPNTLYYDSEGKCESRSYLCGNCEYWLPPPPPPPPSRGGKSITKKHPVCTVEILRTLLRCNRTLRRTSIILLRTLLETNQCTGFDLSKGELKEVLEKDPPWFLMSIGRSRNERYGTPLRSLREVFSIKRMFEIPIRTWNKSVVLWMLDIHEPPLEILKICFRKACQVRDMETLRIIFSSDRGVFLGHRYPEMCQELGDWAEERGNEEAAELIRRRAFSTIDTVLRTLDEWNENGNLLEELKRLAPYNVAGFEAFLKISSSPNDPRDLDVMDRVDLTVRRQNPKRNPKARKERVASIERISRKSKKEGGGEEGGGEGEEGEGGDRPEKRQKSK